MVLEPALGILGLCCEDFFPGFQSEASVRENDKAKIKGQSRIERQERSSGECHARGQSVLNLKEW